MPGGIPPILLPNDIKKYIDKDLMKKDFVYGSGGDRFTGLKIKVNDILKYNENIEWSDKKAL